MLAHALFVLLFAQLGLAGLQEPIFSDRTTMAPYTPTSEAGPAATGAAGGGSGVSAGADDSAGNVGGASGAQSAAGPIRASTSASGKSSAASAAASSAGYIDFPTYGTLVVPVIGAAVALYL